VCVCAYLRTVLQWTYLLTWNNVTPCQLCTVNPGPSRSPQRDVRRGAVFQFQEPRAGTWRVNCRPCHASARVCECTKHIMEHNSFLKRYTQAQVEGGKITVSIYDANTFRRNVLIGKLQVYYFFKCHCGSGSILFLFLERMLTCVWLCSI